MSRHILFECLPYLTLMALMVGVLRALMWCVRAKLDLRRLRQLHQDEIGAVQSLSFVLTVPLFVIVLMFIVQLSQLTIAKIVVEYSAFTAARAAMVWIPARVNDNENENQPGVDWAYVGHVQEATGPGFSVYRYEIGTGTNSPSTKFKRIHLAAAQACMSIAPSRNVGSAKNHPGQGAANTLTLLYQAISPATAQNTQIPSRLANKLAYALENTRLTLEVRHRDDEPELRTYYDQPYQPPVHVPQEYWYPDHEFFMGELGWQDQLSLTVEHDFALLPGPGRLLARRASAPIGSDPSQQPGTDSVATRIQKKNNVFVYTVSATARLSNEGEKPRLRYWQRTIPALGSGATLGPPLPTDPDDPVEDSAANYMGGE